MSRMGRDSRLSPEELAIATTNRTGDHSRLRRGSAWADDAWAFRQRFEPGRRYDHVGFRVVAVRS